MRIPNAFAFALVFKMTKERNLKLPQESNESEIQ